MLAAIAMILAILAAFGVDVGDVSLGWLAVAFLAAALLFGNWPLGYTRNRP